MHIQERLKKITPAMVDVNPKQQVESLWPQEVL